MNQRLIRSCLRAAAMVVVISLMTGAAALATTIRLVTYNIDCDTGTSTPQPGLDTVLAAIGNEQLNGHAQPIDVLVLQELYFTPSTTLQPIIDQLNTIYGAGTYAFDTFVGTNTGNTTGNGPNGLIYNTKTVQVLEHVGIGTTGTSGAARQPVRYKILPVGYGANSGAAFYIYASHYKASSGSSNASRRNVEATNIRNDADALGPNVHIIYAGDFNLTGGRTEAAWQTLTVTPGNGLAHDVANPAGTWTNTISFYSLMTESATSLNIRFDFQLVSGAVLNQPGLQYAAGTYATFGNNGSLPTFGGDVSSANNTALADLANRLQVLSLLTTVTDHLPVVADYNIVGLSVPPNPCKPNIVTQSLCLSSVDLLSYLSLYFTDYDGHGSAVPGDNQTMPQVNPTGTVYAVACSGNQLSAVPPIVTAAGLKADYDGDCQVTSTDLLGYLADYFNPASACFSGCPALLEMPAAPTRPSNSVRTVGGQSVKPQAPKASSKH